MNALAALLLAALAIALAPSPASAPALVAGRRVRVPLGALTRAEAARVRTMLARQLTTPGRAATAPTTGLRLVPGTVALCDLRPAARRRRRRKGRRT